MYQKNVVLLVDDDPNLRRTLCDILEAEGYYPKPYPNATGALNEIDQIVPSVALIDIKLGDMSGLDLMRDIKDRHPDTECILLTGYASRETAIEALNIGAYSYLEKPYDVTQLLLTIRRAVERRKAYIEFRRLKEFHESILQNLTEGVLCEDENGSVTYVNPAMANLLGYQPEVMVGKHWTSFCPLDQRAVAEAATDALQKGVKTLRYEIELLRKDGTHIPVQVSVSSLSDGNRSGGTLSVFTDISERKRTEEKLRYMLNHDTLTGLFNRAFFEEELARLERGRQFLLSIVMADIDGLKQVNDNYGHDAGDETLRRAAEVLRSTFRAEDLVARIGGDEFAVLLPHAPESVVDNTVERLRKAVISHNEQHGDPMLSLSIGTSTVHKGDAINIGKRKADQRMYQDKLNKNNGVRSWNSFS